MSNRTFGALMSLLFTQSFSPSKPSSIIALMDVKKSWVGRWQKNGTLGFNGAHERKKWDSRNSLLSRAFSTQIPVYLAAMRYRLLARTPTRDSVYRNFKKGSCSIEKKRWVEGGRRGGRGRRGGGSL